jgi:hypothetical protein
MPGAIAANLHEGSRSEYLAQYVFSSWGTVVTIPHQEDSGLDLFCTLVERQGRRAWAKSPYTVQVKSTMDAWEFKGEDEIKWLIEHPLPLFLCVVDKSLAHLRVYQTSPRFHVWAGGSLPQQLSLVPTTETEGESVGWKKGDTFSLHAPILDFTIEDTFREGFIEQARKVVQTWVDVEYANLDRQRIGIRRFIVPLRYKRNEPPDMRSSAIYAVPRTRIVADDELDQALTWLKESLGFVADELHKRKDACGAALTLLLYRHLYPGHLEPYMADIIHDLHLDEDPFRHVCPGRAEQVINEASAARGCGLPDSAK